AAGDLYHRDFRSFRYPVTGLHQHGFHPPRDCRGYVHRGLVGFERDEAVLELDLVAGLHVNFDNFDVTEIPEVRYHPLRLAGEFRFATVLRLHLPLLAVAGRARSLSCLSFASRRRLPLRFGTPRIAIASNLPAVIATVRARCCLQANDDIASRYLLAN